MSLVTKTVLIDFMMEHEDVIIREQSPVVEYVESFYLRKPWLYSRDKIDQITALTVKEANHVKRHIEAILAQRRIIEGGGPVQLPKHFNYAVAEKIATLNLTTIKRVRIKGKYYIYAGGKGHKGRILQRYHPKLINEYKRYPMRKRVTK